MEQQPITTLSLTSTVLVIMFNGVGLCFRFFVYTSKFQDTGMLSSTSHAK